MKNELPLARPITPVAIPNDRAMTAYGAAMSGFWRLRPVVDRVRTVWAGNSARPYLATAWWRPRLTTAPGWRWVTGWAWPMPSSATTLRATVRPWRMAYCAVGGEGLANPAEGSGTAAQSPIAQTPFIPSTRIYR